MDDVLIAKRKKRRLEFNSGYKKEALMCARDLQYSDAAKEAIKNARSDEEIEQIMYDARNNKI